MTSTQRVGNGNPHQSSVHSRATNLGDLYARLPFAHTQSVASGTRYVAAKSKVARIQTLLADGVGGITEPAQQPDLLRAIGLRSGRKRKSATSRAGMGDAWSRRDVKRYLSYYDHQFLTPTGLSRQAWEAQRRAAYSANGISRSASPNLKSTSPQPARPSLFGKSIAPINSGRKTEKCWN